jgi:hypothetical protein
MCRDTSGSATSLAMLNKIELKLQRVRNSRITNAVLANGGQSMDSLIS